jgi:hypothetical protein
MFADFDAMLAHAHQVGGSTVVSRAFWTFKNKAGCLFAERVRIHRFDAARAIRRPPCHPPRRQLPAAPG